MPNAVASFARSGVRACFNRWPRSGIRKPYASLLQLLLWILGCQLSLAPTRAQDLQDSQVDIAYLEPRSSEYRYFYAELKRRKVLEELREFLSPLELPRKILVKTDECGTDTIPYQPGQPIILCYEYVARIVKLAPTDTTSSGAGVSRENAIVGAFVQFVLHQVSLAVFDLLEVPVWGRVQDAADNLAAYIMLQFGKDLAVRTLTGSIWFFEASNRTWTGSDFASEASPEIQRFYNYLCIAYGGDPETFKDIVRDNLLKTRRAGRCAVEYLLFDYAFKKTILPHINLDLLRTVQSMQWVSPDEDHWQGRTKKKGPDE